MGYGTWPLSGGSLPSPAFDQLNGRKDFWLASSTPKDPTVVRPFGSPTPIQHFLGSSHRACARSTSHSPSGRSIAADRGSPLHACVCLAVWESTYVSSIP